jgi:hypothetical protein
MAKQPSAASPDDLALEMRVEARSSCEWSADGQFGERRFRRAPGESVGRLVPATHVLASCLGTGILLVCWGGSAIVDCEFET